MDPEEDYMTIAEAEELMAKTEGVRKKELDDAHAKLRGSHTPNPENRLPASL